MSASFPERRKVTDWLHNQCGIDFVFGNHSQYASTLRYLISMEDYTQFSNRDDAILYIKYVANMISRVGDQVAQRLKNWNPPDPRYHFMTEIRSPLGGVNEIFEGAKRRAAQDLQRRNEQPVVVWAPSQDAIDAFYVSWEWKRLRYDFIKDKDRRCLVCSASAADGIKIVVDHRWPVRRFWNLRFDRSNLQLLCDDCNMGKGSRDTTDWRKSHQQDAAEAASLAARMAGAGS